MWKLLKNTAPIHPHSSHASLINAFLCQLNAFQTDNGVEFTKRFSASGKRNIDFISTDFKTGIQELIRPLHHVITEWKSGNATRYHRIMNVLYLAYFLFLLRIFPLRLQTYNRRDYNQFPMTSGVEITTNCSEGIY